MEGIYAVSVFQIYLAFEHIKKFNVLMKMDRIFFYRRYGDIDRKIILIRKFFKQHAATSFPVSVCNPIILYFR